MTETVAVIGAGPGGLVTARWLRSQGFEPTIFEQGSALGGQWTGLPGQSGVWPAMYTNTSRVLTAFSDLEHEGDLAFLSNRDVLAYLNRYADMFGLRTRIRFGQRVDHLARVGDRWHVTCNGTDEAFDRVVVATGRFRSPAIPAVPGIDTFTGSVGVISTFDYRGAKPYAGKRVLVAGCAVSALEIATELAQLGAARVVVTQRRQRYVLPKFAAGVPSDHRIFTRYGTLANETLPPAEIDRQLKEIVVEANGSPEQYGAPAPDPSLFAAGVTLNQGYLPLVAEGRITVRPWMAVDQRHAGDLRRRARRGVRRNRVRHRVRAGSAVSRATTSARLSTWTTVHLDADRYTFHPDLPGLAIVGMWDQSGGYFVPLELQARWIAYTWGGAIPPPDEAEQRDAIAAYRARRGSSQKTRMNLAALTFARAAGVEPQPGELAGPAEGTAVRSARTELFPARGPRCAARRAGAVRARRRCLRCDHVERVDRAGTPLLVAGGVR